MTDRAGDDGRVLAVARRYEPAVIAAVTILVALLVAPRVGGDGTEAAAPTGVRDGIQRQVPTEPPATTAASAVSDDAAARAPAPGGMVPAPEPPDAPGSSEPVPPKSGTALEPATSPSSRDTPEPLRVVDAAWSGADGGSPAAGVDVPEGSLPVSSGVGGPDRRSYIRLAGSAPTLSLVVVEDPVGSRFRESASVWLCPITEPDWEGRPGMSEADAPTYDCTVHAVGRPGGAEWTFDLAPLGNPGRPEGFALVPAEGAADFQVLFARD